MDLECQVGMNLSSVTTIVFQKQKRLEFCSPFTYVCKKVYEIELHSFIRPRREILYFQ